MPDITIHTIETAPEEVKDVLQTVKDANGGFIPNLIGLLANAPTALEAYRTVGEINRRNSLTPTEREVVQITAAVTNGCAFCVAGHTAFSIKQIQMALNFWKPFVTVHQSKTIQNLIPLLNSLLP